MLVRLRWAIMEIYIFSQRLTSLRLEIYDYVYINMRRKLKDNNIRKIYVHGNSLGVTMPREILNKLKWRKGQKLVVKKRGKGILITDWEK